MKKKIVLWFLTIFGMIFLGTLFVTSVYLINNENLAENFKKSQNQMKEIGEYQKLDNTNTSTLDNFTDSLMLLTASYSGDENLLERSMNNYRLSEDGKDPYYTMIGNMESDNMSVQSYARYWHGYLVILRPLLSIFDYAQIRTINATVQILLLIAVLIMMYRRKVGIAIIPFLSVYFMINPVTIVNSLQYSTVWYIALGCILTYLVFKDKIVKYKLHYLFFTIVGMITSYLDLLTYPIATLGLLLVLVLIAEELDWKSAIKRILICGVFWTLGYGIMWASKWIIASIILNQNVLKNANEAIQSRSSNTLSSGDEIPINTLINLIFKRYHNSVTTSSIWINIIFSIVTYFLFKFKDKIVVKPKKEVLKKETKKFKKRYLKNEKFKTKVNKIFPTVINTLPIMAIGMVPFVWYYALTNHSYVHTFFTFRTLAVFWFALFITLFKIAKDLNKKI